MRGKQMNRRDAEDAEREKRRDIMIPSFSVFLCVLCVSAVQSVSMGRV